MVLEEVWEETVGDDSDSCIVETKMTGKKLRKLRKNQFVLCERRKNAKRSVLYKLIRRKTEQRREGGFRLGKERRTWCERCARKIIYCIETLCEEFFNVIRTRLVPGILKLQPLALPLHKYLHS